MDYTELSIVDEATILRNKIRDAEAQHFSRSVDRHTVNALGGNDDVSTDLDNEIVAIEAQITFLKNQLSALEAFAAGGLPVGEVLEEDEDE